MKVRFQLYRRMRRLSPLLRLQLLPLGHEVLPGDGAGRRGGPVQLRQLVDAAAGGEAVGGGVLRASTCNCSLYLHEYQEAVL